MNSIFNAPFALQIEGDTMVPHSIFRGNTGNTGNSQ